MKPDHVVAGELQRKEGSVEVGLFLPNLILKKIWEKNYEKMDKEVEIVRGGSVIDGAYPV